ALRAARHVGGLGRARPGDRLERRAVRDRAEAVLAADAQVALSRDRHRTRLGRSGRVLAAAQAAGPSPRARRLRRFVLHGGSDRLRAAAAEPLATGLWLPRALSRAHGRRGGLPVRGDRVLRPAARVVVFGQLRRGSAGRIVATPVSSTSTTKRPASFRRINLLRPAGRRAMIAWVSVRVSITKPSSTFWSRNAPRPALRV